MGGMKITKGKTCHAVKLTACDALSLTHKGFYPILYFIRVKNPRAEDLVFQDAVKFVPVAKTHKINHLPVKILLEY